jgi:ankyrin repeat protein
LLERGADPNAVDRAGNTVLMRAAASKHSWEEERKPLIHLLLEKGADPGHKNAQGVTALMLMALNGNPALALLLGVPFDGLLDLNARDEEGNTALIYASRFFVRGWQRRNGWELLQKGADVNAANRKGETALIVAATQYEAEGAQLLLEKGANVNAKTKTGKTALMQAIDGPKEFDNEKHLVYSSQIAKLLVAAGADLNARDADGNSALTLARRRGYQDLAAELEKAGAKEY